MTHFIYTFHMSKYKTTRSIEANFYQKMSLIYVETCMTLFLLWNTKGYILNNLHVVLLFKTTILGTVELQKQLKCHSVLHIHMTSDMMHKPYELPLRCVLMSFLKLNRHSHYELLMYGFFICAAVLF